MAQARRGMGTRELDTGEDVKVMLQAFQTFDINGDGLISFDELCTVFHALDKDQWSTSKLTRLLREADTNKDGKIDYEEFIAYICTGTTSNWCKEAILQAAKGPAKLTLSVKDAEQMIRFCKPSDWRKLAGSTDMMEQLVMRVALVYVGNEDPTWENAQSMLSDPFMFLRAMFDAESGESLTVERVRRADALGCIHLERLEKGSIAWVLAQYLTACLTAAKERLHIVESEGTHLPAQPGKVSKKKWPIKIDLKELPIRLREAVQYKKTPLLICNGMEREVDQYFRYRGYLRIDAKRILVETSFLRNAKGMEEAREEMRQVVVAAMKANVPLFVSMGNTALSLRDKFCAEGSFPKSLFAPRLWNNVAKHEADRDYMQILTPAELENIDSWQAGPGMLGSEFYVVVTSDFDKEAATEHLPPAIPYLSEMAIIEIDPPVGGSYSWGGDEGERATKFGIADE